MDPNSNLNYRREIGPLSFPIPKLSISFPHLLALVPATAKDQDTLPRTPRLHQPCCQAQPHESVNCCCQSVFQMQPRGWFSYGLTEVIKADSSKQNKSKKSKSTSVISNYCHYQSLGQFFCVGLGSMFYLLCLDSCLQTSVLKKIKTARLMLRLSYT